MTDKIAINDAIEAIGNAKLALIYAENAESFESMIDQLEEIQMTLAVILNKKTASE